MCDYSIVPVTYTPSEESCPMISGEPIGIVVEDRGNGIYDTTYITSEGGGGGSYSSNSSIKSSLQRMILTDRALYYEAITKRKEGDFAGAISKCKDLINGYDSSSYFISSLSELYLNYLESDTIENQTITTGLFSSLKTYLEQKMQQYENNPVFVEKAYKYLLMCLVKMTRYTEAVAGYENIMNNHPDAVTRLNASWDRSAVILLMGQGGSKNDLKVNNYTLRMKRLLDKNPAHKIAKDMFKSKESDLSERSDNVSDKSKIKYTKEEKTELNQRIERFNPSSRTDLQIKIKSDITLLNYLNNRKSESSLNSVTPKRFNLYQNYPNPFNPKTTIKYDIPKDGLVTIKIYDLLGREVFNLREFKTSGSYEVKFDGSNFASGLYFYSIESGNFKETKKMVLVK